MTDDRGAAALADVLFELEGTPDHPQDRDTYYRRKADAILGEHGRFLPDGENRPDVLRELDLISRAASAQVEVERYKAALAAVVAAWDDDATPEDDGFDPMTHAIDSARAALSPEPKP